MTDYEILMIERDNSLGFKFVIVGGVRRAHTSGPTAEERKAAMANLACNEREIRCSRSRPEEKFAPSILSRKWVG